jgi:hypothetical protein
MKFTVQSIVIKKLKFQYGNYNIEKNFNFHHNGEYYIVQPYNLVWYNDFYYLVAYDKKKNTMINNNIIFTALVTFHCQNVYKIE